MSKTKTVAVAKNKTVSPFEKRSDGFVVDSLGALKAHIAQLTAEETVLKDILIARGKAEYNGAIYRATVSTTERETLNMDAVRAKLSAQFIRAHTDTSAVTSVRVVARIRDSVPG
jgi:uncharacterized Zn finger protein